MGLKDVGAATADIWVPDRYHGVDDGHRRRRLYSSTTYINICLCSRERCRDKLNDHYLHRDSVNNKLFETKTYLL